MTHLLHRWRHALCLATVVFGLAATNGEAADRPNIIYILADDLGYRELGCFGQKVIRTPNIDKLAAEGMMLTQHYSGSAVCAPTRCASTVESVRDFLREQL